MIVPVDANNVLEAGRIHSAAWQASHRAFCTAEFVALHTPARQAEYLRKKLAAGARVFLLAEDRPLGVVSVTGSLIEDLYVLPEAQNRGYGTRLLRHAVSLCPDTPTLWILENNGNARRLYEREGFRPTGRRNRIADGLDEIEFARTAPTEAGNSAKGMDPASTLYVSDLDGTLLRGDQRTSAYTNRVVNALVERGLRFSYATARSANTARQVTAGMTAAFPIIVYNGAFIRDNVSGEILLRNFFAEGEARAIAAALLDAGVKPIVYAFVDGEEKFSYLAGEINPGARAFVESRRGDPRDRPVQTEAELLRGEIFYFTCIDDPERLEPLYARYREACHCVYQRDIYSGEQWLELMPRAASKANAIRQLKQQLGCKRLVVFGDGVNDADMFELADEAYAVANAVPELKRLATAVIGGNDEDGVAHWLAAHARPDGYV